MPIKNGKQFLDTLSAEREIYIEGERVKDVISDPRFSGATKTMAHLMDIQSDPDLSDVMTTIPPRLEIKSV